MEATGLDYSVSGAEQGCIDVANYLPKTRDYIENLITDFYPLSGDRAFSEDKAIMGGFGKFRD